MKLPGSMNCVKCVVVGDSCVGKTCLLTSYASNKFTKEHHSTIFDNHATNIITGEKSYTLCFFDTAGQEDYEYLRPLAYPEADIFLVCFSVIEPDSFVNVSKIWIPEIKQHCGQNVSFFLVGLKEDLRNDEETIRRLQARGKKPVTAEEGASLAKNVKAEGYLECSAKTQKGLKNVFTRALQTVTEQNCMAKPRKSQNMLSCCVKA